MKEKKKEFSTLTSIIYYISSVFDVLVCLPVNEYILCQFVYLFFVRGQNTFSVFGYIYFLRLNDEYHIPC